MNLTITFNWPPPDKASVSLGSPNMNDAEWEFRVGVIPKDEKDKIYWLEPRWFSGDMEKDLTFGVQRGDEVVVERKQKGSTKTETSNTWDIDEEWPAEAHGASMTIVPWEF